MKILRVESWAEDVPLTRPYTIARKTTRAVRLSFVRLVTEGSVTGCGAASPSKDVTGEDAAACEAALAPAALDFLVGRDARRLGANLAAVEAATAGAPAARAALDVALHDLLARHLDVPLVDLLGERRRRPLSTSITIGIRALDETLDEAREYLARGFRHLKIKLGHSIDGDEERLCRLRELVGPGVGLRVDANEGYDLDAARRVLALAERLDLELVEQPLPRGQVQELAALSAAERRRVALDESVCDEADALRFAAPPHLCGAFVIKLMKCGGLAAASSIARIARAAGRDLMWGCMDESAVSIAAALHAAYAAPATRWLDLDGSFDLARDPGRGGFRVADGELHLTDAPGLGVRLAGASGRP